MNNLEFNDGLERLAINGDENRIIIINPTDISVIKRYNEVIPQLDELTEKYKEVPQDKTIEIISELDKKAREIIDYIIGSPVSETVFGTANCLSYAGGQTIFENFLTAYMDYMTPTIKSEYDKSQKRVKKYTNQLK